MPAAAGQHLRSLGTGVGDMALDLVEALVVDDRPLLDPVFHAVAHFHRCCYLGQAASELVIDSVLHEDAVGADTGLAGIAVFRGHGAGDGRIDIGIVEDDQRRVAAELEAHLLQRVGALAHQDAADFGRTGEGHLADTVVIAQRFADGRAVHAGNDIDDAGGNAGTLGQFGQRQRRQRCLLGRFQYTGAARGDPRGDLAGDHRNREVPRGDRAKHADRLLECKEALVRDRAFHDIAADPARLFGEPVDEARAIGNLAARLGNRLAHLGGQNDGQVLGIRHDQLVPLAHHHGAVLGGAGGPGFLCRHRRVDGGCGFGRTEIRHLGNGLAGGRVGHGKPLVRGGGSPGAVDIGIGAKKGWVVQVHLGVTPEEEDADAVAICEVSVFRWQLAPVHVVERCAVGAKPVGACHFDIMSCRACDVGDIIVAHITHFLRWTTGPDLARRDYLAWCQHRAGGKHTLRFDHGAVHHHRPHADKGTVADRAGMHQRAVPDGDIVTDDGRVVAAVDVKAAIILNVRVLANDDVVVVAAKRCLMPDRAVRTDPHGADDGRRRGDKGAGVDLRDKVHEGCDIGAPDMRAGRSVLGQVIAHGSVSPDNGSMTRFSAIAWSFIVIFRHLIH